MDINILIAEDDKDIVELLSLYLENEGYKIYTARNGEEAYEKFIVEDINVCIFDIMMPKLNGYDLVKKIRETSQVPILILSAKNQDNDKIIGLNIGADDYMSKPFNPLEVIARINAMVRRNYDYNTEEKSKILNLSSIKINTETLSVFKNDEPVYLTPTELKILMTLIKEPGKIITKVQLYKNINGEYIETDDNTIMVHISRLRDKIEDDPRNPKYIKTIRGLGYKFENND
ncbi:MAG: response regulator transcription factor [Erysipelotrichaceae bacterium]|nr:response regulator transcription factor [Erysipelotrichaceae bacterium]